MNAHVRNFDALAAEQMNSMTASSQAISGKIAGLVNSNVSYSKRSFEDAAEFVQSLAEKREVSGLILAQTKFCASKALLSWRTARAFRTRSEALQQKR